MGGEISLTSFEGEGTTLDFTLPTTFNQSSLPPTSIDVKKTQEKSNKLADNFPRRILIAEDNPVNQRLLQVALTKQGYKPDISNNGKEAVEACLAKEYDLVFMDIQMPEMDGLEATRIIKSKLNPAPTIIAVTANAMATDREMCLKAGMDDFISKPITISDLLKAVSNCAPLKSKSA